MRIAYQEYESFFCQFTLSAAYCISLTLVIVTWNTNEIQWNSSQLTMKVTSEHSTRFYIENKWYQWQMKSVHLVSMSVNDIKLSSPQQLDSSLTQEKQKTLAMFLEKCAKQMLFCNLTPSNLNENYTIIIIMQSFVTAKYTTRMMIANQRVRMPSDYKNSLSFSVICLKIVCQVLN